MSIKTKIVTLALAVGFAAGCGGGGGSSSVRAACERGDECDLLDGQSVGDCTDEGNDIYSDLNSDEKAAFEDIIDACLALATCAEFDACIGGA
jgi:hypothetical protein